jgi:type IV pilus assembly protein PilY1
MFNKLLCSAVMALVVISGGTYGDDTELYLTNTATIDGKRPQVLFIFDNSGSMSTEDANTSSDYHG